MPASDVATLSLFGYDPLQVYTGRSPLEAAAMGIQLGPNDWAIRCNLVTVENGEMRDFTAGHIPSEEGRPLVEAVHAALGGPVAGGRLEFHPGITLRPRAGVRLIVRHPPRPDAANGSENQPVWNQLGKGSSDCAVPPMACFSPTRSATPGRGRHP